MVKKPTQSTTIKIESSFLNGTLPNLTNERTVLNLLKGIRQVAEINKEPVKVSFDTKPI